jgi:hypothetical protein
MVKISVAMQLYQLVWVIIDLRFIDTGQPEQVTSHNRLAELV